VTDDDVLERRIGGGGVAVGGARMRPTAVEVGWKE